jgi:hypothetical protein
MICESPRYPGLFSAGEAFESEGLSLSFQIEATLVFRKGRSFR